MLELFAFDLITCVVIMSLFAVYCLLMISAGCYLFNCKLFVFGLLVLLVACDGFDCFKWLLPVYCVFVFGCFDCLVTFDLFMFVVLLASCLWCFVFCFWIACFVCGWLFLLLFGCLCLF